MRAELPASQPVETHVRLRTKVARVIVRFLMQRLFRVEISGLERFPEHDGALIVCNHLSWIDNFVLFIGLPMRRRLYFIGDATGTSDAWLKRQGIDLVGGLIPIDRYQSVGDRTALNRALEVLRAGSNLVIYPEGERGEDEGRLLPLRRGIGFLARQANAPTVALGLGGTRFLWRGKTLRLHVGAVLQPPAPGKAGEQVYMDEVRRAMLGAMPPADPAPANPQWQWLTTLL